MIINYSYAKDDTIHSPKYPKTPVNQSQMNILIPVGGHSRENLLLVNKEI